MTGTATDKEGDTSGTGGIFGINHSAITGSILENLTGDVSINTEKGQVAQNVGGLIGINTGDVSTSSLKNEADIKVEGDNVSNIGGLIGQNTGTITGGRTEADGTDVGYYKYQIYNNGTITVTGNGENIGGLIGNNAKDEDNSKTGSLTAGYNTGAIIAGGSTNVGGIAGTNAGTLDQVFNTVITGVNEDGSTAYGTITGGTSVGGIAGANSGKISNAYNTSEVKGTTSGSLVGTNNGFVENVYGSGTLIGSGAAATNVYDADTDSFGDNGSTIDTVGGQSAIWRQYGENNPILKVFLTTVTYDPTKNDQHFVYNGKNEKLDIDELIGTGAFNAADKFNAHKNADGGLIYHDDDNDVDAGKYTDELWSEQIKAGGEGDTFNPNYLGYDVKSIKYERDKATINVSLNDIYRQYGNSDMYKDSSRTELSNAYDDYYQISVGNKDDFAEGVWENALGQIGVTVMDGGKGTDNKATANAGDYDWSVQLDISEIAKNYQFGEADSDATKTFTGSGQSHVAKAKLTVELGDVERTYGNTTITDGGYVVSNITGLVNGDATLGYDSDDFNVTVTGDSALTGETTGNVGDYTWTGTVTGKDGDLTNLSTNYDIEVNGTGVSKVNKAKLTVGLGDVERTYGSTTITEGGYVVSGISGLVNGDATLGYDSDDFNVTVTGDSAL